jgi:transcriptional regulator GlxA family with amidase domain
MLRVGDGSEATRVRIDILLFDGFDELDALAPYEVLRRAAEAGADIQTRLVTLEETAEVTAFYGLRLRPDGMLGFDPAPDMLIVPGGGWNHQSAEAPRGARFEAERGAIPAALAQLHASGVILTGVCTGGMLLAAAGLTAGRPATTHHLALDDLRATATTVVEARVVDDGDLVTARGVTSGLDLALWLVERFAGSRIAHRVESRLEYERRGVVWRRA